MWKFVLIGIAAGGVIYVVSVLPMLVSNFFFGLSNAMYSFMDFLLSVLMVIIFIASIVLYVVLIVWIIRKIKNRKSNH